VKKSVALSSEARSEGGATGTSVEVSVMGAEQRGLDVPVASLVNYPGRRSC
jgi:hypothetical protein